MKAAIKKAHTVEIIRETENTFIATLNNGDMRFGIKGLTSKDVSPFKIPSFSNDDNFDDFVDSLFE